MTTYDELGYLEDNAADAGLPWSGPPPVGRRSVTLDGGRTISALAWGQGPAEAVLLHGRAQNAHTWDTVGLALLASGSERSFVAVDLPGHGLSGWRDDHDYGPATLAGDVSAALSQLAPTAGLLVGMSLGGLTSLALLDADRGSFERLVLVDITPGVGGPRAQAVADFTSGPEHFASFAEILDRTVRFNPGRSESSLRRGVLHNARELPDGRWAWRWDPQRAAGPGTRPALWDALVRLAIPLTLVRGGASAVVTDEDVAELARRRPDADVVVVEGSGHSVQGDRPLVLAQVLAERWPGPDGAERK